MTPQAIAKPTAEAIPPLHHGDRLSLAEFRRRYEATPEHFKAELIRGVVHIPGPVRAQQHGIPHAHLIGWLGLYATFTPGTEVSDNTTVRELEPESEPQPDALLHILASHGGRTRVNADGYLEGPPELIGEIAASTTSVDLGEKMDLYRAAGVREYIVLIARKSAIQWYVLRDGNYERLQPEPNGWYKSEVFPGLWLDPKALLERDMIRVHEVVQAGLASPEHAAFVEKLQDAANSKRESGST